MIRRQENKKLLYSKKDKHEVPDKREDRGAYAPIRMPKFVFKTILATSNQVSIQRNFNEHCPAQKLRHSFQLLFSLFHSVTIFLVKTKNFTLFYAVVNIHVVQTPCEGGYKEWKMYCRIWTFAL
jgi:hypothetical protein